MDKMSEQFEDSGAGGNWEYPVDRDDPSVEWAWKIWKAAWIAATNEARDTYMAVERSNA